ncbi:MAG: hypothetical protein NC240_06975 [Clostridium sp.]|nr:hypothetical protein [Clostridium sp.]
MQEHKVILTWEAIYDLTDIADYIERDFGKNRADRLEKYTERTAKLYISQIKSI